MLIVVFGELFLHHINYNLVERLFFDHFFTSEALFTQVVHLYTRCTILDYKVD